MKIPVIKGAFGEFTYYLGKAKASEFVEFTRRPRKDDDWNEEDLDQYQRDLNESRVLTEIIPYLAKNSDRFFPPITLIPTVKIIFKPFENDLGQIEFDNQNYKKAFVILDGIHRHYAIDLLQNEKTDQQGDYAMQVKYDDISFVIIDLPIIERKKVRRLFTKLNKHAKPTSKAINIVIDEDDPAALVTRELIRSNDLFVNGSQRLVELMNNTIRKNNSTITNQSTIYNSVKYIAKSLKADTDSRRVSTQPDEKKVSDLLLVSKVVWTNLLNRIDAYTIVRKNPDRAVDYKTKDSPWSLLFEPAGQESIIESICIAIKKLKLRLDQIDDDKINQLNFILEVMVPSYNKIIWSRDKESAFIGYILSTSLKITRQRDDIKRASELLYYLAHEGKIDEKTKESVESNFRKLHGDKSNPLFLRSKMNQ